MKYWQPFGITDPAAGYINGDPTIGRAGSIPPAGAFEQPQRELVNLITASRLQPDETSVIQLLSAVRSQQMNYAIDDGAGSPNDISVAFNPPIADTMLPGMPLRIKSATTVTGSCTLTVDGITHPLRHGNGTELVANDILASETFEVVWNNTYWAMTNYNGEGGGTGAVNNYVTKIPYTVDVGTTSNVVIANFTPTLPTPVPGDAIEVKLANNITGPATISINGGTARALKRGDGSPMKSGDGVTSQIALLTYRDDGTWQYTGIIPQQFTGYGLPVGALVLVVSDVAPLGTLKLNGAILNRSEHPNLWTYANASNRLVNDSDWSNPTMRNWTAFSSGNGTTTFRLPDFRGEFPRWYDDGRGIDYGRTLKTQQGDSVGSITLSGVIDLNNPRFFMPSLPTDPIPTQLQKDHWVENGEFAWQFLPGAMAGQPPESPGQNPYNDFFAAGYDFGGGGSAKTPYSFSMTIVAPGTVTHPPLDVSFGSQTTWWPQGNWTHRQSRISSNFSVSGTGGGNETKPRNTAIMPCIVDG